MCDMLLIKMQSVKTLCTSEILYIMGILAISIIMLNLPKQLLQQLL